MARPSTKEYRRMEKKRTKKEKYSVEDRKRVREQNESEPEIGFFLIKGRLDSKSFESL